MLLGVLVRLLDNDCDRAGQARVNRGAAVTILIEISALNGYTS